MSLVRALRSKSKLRGSIAAAEAIALRHSDPADIQAWQLKQFNRLWPDILQRVPWYRDQQAARRWPTTFASWDEFRQCVPVMTRSQLQDELSQRVDTSRSADGHRATGGSTAEPLRFPCWSSEETVTGTAVWQARSWLGISPRDRLFLLWGHSHLFGTGWRGTIRRVERRAKDFLLGYCRWPAYDLSTPALRRAADRLCQFRPQYMIGYSVALDEFAAANQDRGPELQSLGLKAIIATAEAFPTTDSRARISALFRCPVVMEYGTVETGILAQELREGHYRALWQNHLLEIEERPDSDGRGALLVTSLFPRCLPLIRYRVGDLIEPIGEAPWVTELCQVAGRCNDLIELPTGQVIHSEAIAHIVRDFPEVLGYQAVLTTDGRLELLLRTPGPLSENLAGRLRQRLGLLDHALETVEIRRADRLAQSIAGKTPTVIRAG
jgi:phenylacetate-CoA ligase